MNDYFVIRKEGTTPRILSLTLDKRAQDLLNQEFSISKSNFLNKIEVVVSEENGKKVKKK